MRLKCYLVCDLLSNRPVKFLDLRHIELQSVAVVIFTAWTEVSLQPKIITFNAPISINNQDGKTNTRHNFTETDNIDPTAKIEQ